MVVVVVFSVACLFCSFYLMRVLLLQCVFLVLCLMRRVCFVVVVYVDLVVVVVCWCLCFVLFSCLFCC